MNSSAFIEDSTFGHSGGSHIKEQGSPVELVSVSKADTVWWGGKGTPIFVKIDTEGYELEVLKGILALLKGKLIEKMIVEIDHENLLRYGSSSQQIYEFVERFGYRATVDARSKHYDEVFVKAVN